MKLAPTGTPEWRDAGDICTLADGDRHLGHIVYTGEWEAFDAIHPNDSGNGFRHLGVFHGVYEAKTAVERAIGQSDVDAIKRSAVSTMWIS